MAKKKSSRARKAAGKASRIARSGKGQVDYGRLSERTLRRIVSDAQGTSTQKDRAAARQASNELAKRSSKPKKKKS